MSNSIKLSAVITAHHEGLIAHKTMLSVFDALDKVEDSGYQYEIIIHIDNGDSATTDYFKRYANNKKITILQNSFGDLGLSRNCAAECAKGEYVAFLDSDDLISDNWFINGIRILDESKAEIVVHPEAVLTFGAGEHVLTIQRDSYDKEGDTRVLLGENRWGSVVMGKKSTFAHYPYRKMGRGYGFEDYLFNIETIHNNVSHRIAKDTVLFYRRSGESMLNSYNDDKRTLPYVKLFDFAAFRSTNNSRKVLEVPTKTKILNNGRKIYKKIRSNDSLNYFITPVAKAVKYCINHNGNHTDVPDFVEKEWAKINKIETQLYPDKHELRSVKKYVAEVHLAVGDAYAEIANNITQHKPDYIFIVPWLVRGGAEKVLLNYVNGLLRNNANTKITVIATLPVEHAWRSKMPNSVDFIDFGNISVALTPDEQDQLFTRLVVQLQCRHLHIINSEFGYKWAKGHKNLIKGQNYILDTSLFAYEYIQGSHMKGVYSYDDPYLFDIFDIVNKVFTDNASIINYTVKKNGFDPSKFQVIYQPTSEEMVPPSVKTHHPVKILWASRIVRVKLPEVLAQIGSRIDPNKYVIDVYGEMGDDVPKDIFANSPAVKYRRPFNGFQDLPRSEADIFLYTSMNDGIPNILLEAIASGLPIIASNDGGVGEIIKNGKTGVLVEDPLDVDSYVNAIEEFASKPTELELYANNAQKLLKKQHSWTTFLAAIKDNF